MANNKPELAAIQEEVVVCRACPRLVAHREEVAVRKTRRFAEETYWGRPVPSFGDPQAQLLIVGLAPAAHGANRTGRMFTGDRSGEWLFEAMYQYGFSTQPAPASRKDGLKLENAYITAVVRCAPPANKPSRLEKETCRSFLVRELAALQRLRVVLALGKIGFDGFLAAWAEMGGQVPRPKPKFAHRAACTLADGLHLLASYHPSQQNTFTGRLTRPMFHDVFREARRRVDAPAGRAPSPS
ncbi:MAG: uracil-DNA glycosylase family protein [Anaerolineae bacterium]|nr:MAG: uracil-DNA glycosylase family protein [Anaerolineae bacterium]